MKIRREQLEGMEAAMRQRLKRDLASYLASVVPHRVAAADEARFQQQLDTAFDRVELYAFEEVAPIKHCHWYLFEFGLESGTTPRTRWVAEVLEELEATDEERLENLDSGLLDAMWSEPGVYLGLFEADLKQVRGPGKRPAGRTLWPQEADFRHVASCLEELVPLLQRFEKTKEAELSAQLKCREQIADVLKRWRKL